MEIEPILKLKLMQKGLAVQILTTQRVFFMNKLFEFWAVGESEKGNLRRVHGYYDAEKDQIIISENQPLSYNA